MEWKIGQILAWSFFVKCAILIDLDFFIRRYLKLSNENLSNFSPAEKADKIALYLFKHSKKHLNYYNSSYELFRIYIYDCPPLGKKLHHPLTNKATDFSKTDVATFRNRLHEKIREMPNTALRLGKLDENNVKWIISNYKKYKKLLRGEIKIEDLNEEDFKIDVKQKQVDMKIGIDITWLSLKRLVDVIVLISGDSDFVPASKLARREGITFILDALHHQIKPDLKEHIDLLRTPNIKDKEQSN